MLVRYVHNEYGFGRKIVISHKKRNFQINPEIPIIIGTNRNEGEIFVHSAFPAAMPKVSFNMSIICLYFII